MQLHVALLLPLVLLMALSACSSTRETHPSATPAVQATPQTEDLSTATTLPGPTSTVLPTSLPVPYTDLNPAPAQSSLTEDELWVRDRLRAVESLYNLTPEGRRAVESLDVRPMRDQPGFFGSYGYKYWTGVGEAIPKSIMHELGHAYWGLFPVTGFPHLSWDAARGQDISPAMASYHRDVLEFMKQPPDHYELLRSRLRTLPELSVSNPDPLFHTLEADIVYITAGDLDLIPPILQKYWDKFLQAGPFHSWNEAFRWYQALPASGRELADKYIGFEHFRLEGYDQLKESDPTQLQPETQQVLLEEERQRLRDFVWYFDLLSAQIAGTGEQREDFKFWRRYLRDKVALHAQHPQLVASLSGPRSGQIAEALDLLHGLEGKGSDQKAALVDQELKVRPFLVHFLPSLDNRTLLTLFTSGAPLPEGATLKGTAAFVESLERFAPDIEVVLREGRRDVSSGAHELTSYLSNADLDDKEDLELFFEVLQGSDSGTATKVVAALDDFMLRRLLKPIPAQLRSLLSHDRFLGSLDITLSAPADELVRGIEEMIEHPSGNFRIEEPFLDKMYAVIAARGTRAPLETLKVISTSPFPMERFIFLHPAPAAGLLATDLDIAAEMVRSSDPIIFPPARFVHRLIYADPELAARLVDRLEGHGQTSLVVEALSHFAYDADRLRFAPTLPISLERDGRFLKGLLEERGRGWLEERLGEAVTLYLQRVERDEVPSDFLAAYKRTLVSVASRLDDGESGRALEEIIDMVFR